jgi:DNA repair protein RadA/Sms
VVFGEIGLSGGVRPVGHTEARLKEAAKLGFTSAWLPARPAGKRAAEDGGARRGGTGEGMALMTIGHLGELVARLAPSPRRGPRRQPRIVTGP